MFPPIKLVRNLPPKPAKTGLLNLRQFFGVSSPLAPQMPQVPLLNLPRNYRQPLPQVQHNWPCSQALHGIRLGLTLMSNTHASLKPPAKKAKFKGKDRHSMTLVKTLQPTLAMQSNTSDCHLSCFWKQIFEPKMLPDQLVCNIESEQTVLCCQYFPPMRWPSNLLRRSPGYLADWDDNLQLSSRSEWLLPLT